MRRRMDGETGIYSAPRWSGTRWLADAGPGVPHDIRAALTAALFGTLPVFAGGVINTLLVSAVIAARVATIPFIVWFALELTICTSRLAVLLIARSRARRQRRTPTDLYLALGIAWSASVGYGVCISLASGDWVAATLACLSAAAMVGGICIRNFCAPRLATAMILTSIGPCVIGVVLARQPLLYVVLAQVPLYVGAMTAAAFKLNKMLVATMRAERENNHRAQHDVLTGLLNRAGIADAMKSLMAPQNERPSLALFFLDLDGFKTVNDSFGHAAGDRMLKMVGDRLITLLRPHDAAARIGGDEFVVLVNCLSEDGAMLFAQQTVAMLAGAYEIGDGMSATIGVSIGIAIAPQHGTDISDLLAVADAALYEAKLSGKSRCCMAANLRGVNRRSFKNLTEIDAAA